MAETLETIKKYRGPFSGSQMDQIFYEILNYTSERYAKGTQNGQAVAAGTIGYQDNSYYYSRQALQSAQAAENAATRAESAVPAGINSAVLFTQAQTLTAVQKSQARANIAAYALVITSSSFSSLPQTISNSNITDKHVVVNSVLSNPSAQTGNWTVTTSNGSLTISGSIFGTTTITLYLMPNG